MSVCGRDCFYPNFAMAVHPKTCPYLLQLIGLPLPLFSFLQLLKPGPLPFLVPWVHSRLVLCVLPSQFSSIFCPLLFLSPHLQVLIPASMSGYFLLVWWVLRAYWIPALTVHSVSVCHSNLQFLEGEIPWVSSIQTVKPTRDRITRKCSCQFQTSFPWMCANWTFC